MFFVLTALSILSYGYSMEGPMPRIRKPKTPRYWCALCESRNLPVVGERSVFLTKTGQLQCPQCKVVDWFIFEDEPYECTECGVRSEEGRVCRAGDRCSNYQWGTCTGRLRHKLPREITWLPGHKHRHRTPF